MFLLKFNANGEAKH